MVADIGGFFQLSDNKQNQIQDLAPGIHTAGGFWCSTLEFFIEYIIFSGIPESSLIWYRHSKTLSLPDPSVSIRPVLRVVV